MICCQDTDLVTITAHDGDASINEDIVMSVDDQSECKIQQTLICSNVNINSYICTIGPDCLFQIDAVSANSGKLVLKTGSIIPESVTDSVTIVVKVMF